MEKKQKKSGKYDKVVLIPTDFSEVCNNAVRHGVELAKSLKFDIFILHVIDKKSKLALKEEGAGTELIEKKLKAIKTKYEKKCGVSITTVAREGTIFGVINKVAEEIKANLMIMGTHGKKGFQHIFGSYALKVVLDCPCPVIVVQKKSFGKGYENIVFPISNTLEPRSKVQWALLMAKLFNSKIHLYQALEKDKGLNSRLKIITAQITKIFDEQKIPYEIAVAEKTTGFADQVVHYSTVNKMNLIMIMTVPQIDVPGFNVSAWDEKMMFNEDEIPVMCINPTEITDYYFEWLTLI